MQKNNIRMIVQGVDECAYEFSSRLEEICYDLTVKHQDTILNIPTVQLTSDSYGRQTATIQFITDI